MASLADSHATLTGCMAFAWQGTIFSTLSMMMNGPAEHETVSHR